MNALESVLRAASRDLADLHLRWALVGGLAVSARTEPRFTRDVDLVIPVAGDREAEHAVHSLQLRGYQVQALVEQEAAGRLATARLAARGAAGVVLDILFASSGIEPEIVEAAEALEILPGLRIPVATEADLDGARQAVTLIQARGFQRDRDLLGDLERLIAHGI